MTTHASTAENQVRALLEAWAAATREGRQDDVLAGHSADLVVYDVLPPLKYEGAATYRASWDEWQPQTTGEAVFEFEELHVVAGPETAFAHGLIRCGGTMPNGKTFEDRARATFCLRHLAGCWLVVHQHISMPLAKGTS